MRDKTNLGFLPSDGEHMKGYVIRLKDVVQQIRNDDSAPHIKWYTHYNAGPCFICEMLDILDYLVNLMEDICNYDKKASWKCVRPANSHDALTFTFQRLRVT